MELRHSGVRSPDGLNQTIDMSLLTFYGDESGTDRHNRVAVVAGYVGQVSEWRRFERQWSRVLKRYGVHVMHRNHLETCTENLPKSAAGAPRDETLFSANYTRSSSHAPRSLSGSAIIKGDWKRRCLTGLRDSSVGYMAGARTNA